MIAATLVDTPQTLAIRDQLRGILDGSLKGPLTKQVAEYGAITLTEDELLVLEEVLLTADDVKFGREGRKVYTTFNIIELARVLRRQGRTAPVSRIHLNQGLQVLKAAYPELEAAVQKAIADGKI
jgi:hypothetical protein